MGGTPVFAGTRVPIQTVLEYLEAGETIEDFRRLPHGNSRPGDRPSRRGEGSADRQGIVRILLDECVDWRLSRDVIGHDVKTARQWVGDQQER